MRAVKQCEESTGRMKKHRYSSEFKVTAVKARIRPSMNRPRSCQDNAHIESFFHTLKAEWIRGRTFPSRDALEGAIRAYIRFYNHHRLHSAIDYCTPAEYERLAA